MCGTGAPCGGRAQEERTVANWDYHAPGVRPDRVRAAWRPVCSGSRRDYGRTFPPAQTSACTPCFLTTTTADHRRGASLGSPWVPRLQPRALDHNAPHPEETTCPEPSDEEPPTISSLHCSATTVCKAELHRQDSAVMSL
uniref:Uncharacterized protein n=1 Tax=Knipowitschia caucasica TaxID=637954 RepID=A0AAV2MMB4_KNICA